MRYLSAMATRNTIGNRIAPTRFVLFFAMLAVSIALAKFVTPWWLSVMLGFDVSALVFIVSCIPLYRKDHHEMRAVAEANDANRAILLMLAFALTIVILVAVGSQMASDKHSSALDIAITIVTLLTS